ncbi:hypothetical protein K8I31_19690 [bacterium]|nr:hypothetical protein [bacterium]
MICCLNSGQSISISISRDDEAMRFAAGLLRNQLLLRADFDIRIGDAAPADLLIHLCDAETLPAEIQNRLDPPPKILPYPDYAEHYHVRLLHDGEVPTLVLLAGAAQGLSYAIGYVMQQALVYEDRIEIPELNITRRPLNPLRGTIYIDAPPNEGDIQQYALWGDNCIGAMAFSDEQSRASHEYSIQAIQRCDSNTEIKSEMSIACFHADADLTKRIDFITKTAQQKETWIDASLLNEDQLDTLLLSPLGAVRALAHDPENALYNMMQREMPLTAQLVALCRLCSAKPSELARRHAEAAPLIYAALGVSNQAPTWARIAWAALGWGPITDLGEIFESIGRFYFGARASQEMSTLLSHVENGGPIDSMLKRFNNDAPHRMKELASIWQ